MSSKIKVDTIENVAGSGNVSLGSGHNLVVPGNITGSGTTTLTGNLTEVLTTKSSPNCSLLVEEIRTFVNDQSFSSESSGEKTAKTKL